MKFVLTAFITWKVWTIVFLLFAIYFIPLQINFLGGGLEHYLRFPWFWAWGNFDGEHYLAIAQHGYGNGEQAFFPLYVLLIRILSVNLWQDIYFLQFLALAVSNVSILIGLLGLWKLIRLDFKKNIAQLAIIFILVFPTSFYFGSTYTEGLFFALTVWSFYFARRGNWLLAGVLGAFASATKFLGIILLPALIIEWLERKDKSKRSLLGLLLIPAGLLTYMYYLRLTVGDPLAFFHTLSGFGEQRSTVPILLPQVFWRYVNIILDIPKNNLMFSTVIMEFVMAILFLIVSVMSFFNLRKSYVIYLILGYLIPTFTGSFSSLPRYVLVLFPAFIIFAIYFEKRSSLTRALVVIISFILLGISMSLFVRGYWIS